MEMLEVHRQVLQDSVRSRAADTDILWRMVVLHTHSLVLRPGVTVKNCGPVDPGDDGRVTLSPLTRTHLAELVAACWPPGSRRADPAFWFTAYARQTPYELFDDVPSEHRERAGAALEYIARQDPIDELIAE
jgi:hypothetical protein